MSTPSPLTGEPAKPTSSSSLGKGCLLALLVPVLLIVLLVVLLVVGGALFAALQTGSVMSLFLLLPILLFLGGPIALVVFFRKRKQKHVRMAANPEAPWLWREDWAQRQVRFKESDWFVRWIIAVIWTGASLGFVFVPLQEALEQRHVASLFFLLFPGIGVFMFVWAIHGTWRHLRYGLSTFDLSESPGVIGGYLRGQVRNKLHLRSGDRVRVRLTSYNRYTSGSSKSQTTHYKVLWRAEKDFGVETLARGRGLTVIPIEFFIPRTCRQTEVFGHENGDLWRLEVSAAVPGVRYGAHFDVPVFRTAESDSPEAYRLTELAEQQVLTQARPPATAARITSTPTGGTEYYWAPTRPKLLSFFLGLGVLAAASYIYLSLTGVDFGTSEEDRFMGRIILGFIALGLILVIVGLWTNASRLLLEPGRVRIRNQLFGLGDWKEYAAADISDVQSVAVTSSKKTSHFKIRLSLPEGKTVQVGNGKDNYAGGQWLAAQIKNQIQSLTR